MEIPFVDLLAQHDELRDEIDSAIKAVIDHSSFIGGPHVAEFEQNFASFCGCKHAVACASGTDALKLALMAAGVSRGDEVITTPLTFIATVEAITSIGAYPAFVDIDRTTCNLSVGKLSEFLSKDCRLGCDGYPLDAKTGRSVKIIMPVHLYGLPADMGPIKELAEAHNLTVVEDSCQAHGATCTVKGVETRVGAIGKAGAFSFYPGKNLGGMGEGGAVTSNDDRITGLMRIWRDHGQSERYVHVSPDGWNARLDALQCAILNIKLKKLSEWNDRRRQAAKWYIERLSGDERVVLPVETEWGKHVYHLFVVRVAGRDKVRDKLTAKGIQVGLHYPIPLHLQTAYLDLGYRPGDFPEAEAAASSAISLPMFPHISEQQVDFVCKSLKEALD